MKYLISLTLLLVLISCKNQKVEALQHKIEELERYNLQLKDSLQTQKVEKAVQSRIIVKNITSNLKINKSNKFEGLRIEYKSHPKYDVYLLKEKVQSYSELNESNSILISKDNTYSFFDFEYTPKSKNDTIINILGETRVNGVIVEFPVEHILNFK